MDFVNPPAAFVWMDGIIAPRLFRRYYRRFADAIALESGHRVLDFGCGSGPVAEHLAPRLSGGEIVCLDICPPMLEHARRRLRRHPHVRFIDRPIEHAGLAERSFDRIIVHNALHDIPATERPRIAAALSALLTPGGSLCLREPTKPSHGLPVHDLRALMDGAGLHETLLLESRRFPIGVVVDAVFMRPQPRAAEGTRG